MVVELVISMKMRFVQVYLNGEKCVQCDSSCKSCYGTATSCSTCADGYYFTSMNFEPGQYYTGLCCLCNGTGHENCQLCIENCNDDDKFTCSPNPICTRCSDGFILMISLNVRHAMNHARHELDQLMLITLYAKMDTN